MAIIQGSSASESLTGTEADDRIYGYQGSDILEGLGGFTYV
ncbi:MAG: hypothetical protein AAF215_09865 [Cyanobacteria bacterium P01_A01_bin.123]